MVTSARDAVEDPGHVGSHCIALPQPQALQPPAGEPPEQQPPEQPAPSPEQQPPAQRAQPAPEAKWGGYWKSECDAWLQQWGGGWKDEARAGFVMPPKFATCVFPAMGGETEPQRYRVPWDTWKDICSTVDAERKTQPVKTDDGKKELVLVQVLYDGKTQPTDDGKTQPSVDLFAMD